MDVNEQRETEALVWRVMDADHKDYMKAVDAFTAIANQADEARLLVGFPTDEDVEVAAEAWKQARQSPIVNLAAARAALQAVADARRTEEGP